MEEPMDIEKNRTAEAVMWGPSEGGKVQCFLCNFRCVIAKGRLGRCGVRRNVKGRLQSLNYHRVCAANVDPIEKKPLFHFQPGSKSFSIAAPGCNFRCDFCQNWQISQMAEADGDLYGRSIRPKDIVISAIHGQCKSIAYTYTEPTIFMELASECARLARKEGLANVFVSNGYMSTEAIEFARPWLDGINIDLKSFREEYYKSLCHARLGPVLDTIRYIAKKTDIWMELTTLIVPGQNDSDEELREIARFIATEAGQGVPWHVSRFYPQYHMEDTAPTPVKTLERAYDIGKEEGLQFIYIGNLPGTRAESTFCPSCGTLLVERMGYTIQKNVIHDGRCPQCDAEIPGFGL
ncbi:MAG: AmmeMemoRadiSam system radical SAM enzyme [Sedimentisphaerales bacterium]|nr:AmmeMemoRadiSam system radical SAM enzyme [Sedimentisphaerales bacterium]